MKLLLKETGLRNIKQLANTYKEAWIYGHIDLDGVVSSLVMKYYLAKYGISTTNWIPIQYGAQEYSINKVPPGILGVLVDFSHGNIQFQIHTDHHATQISYPGQSKQFKHSKSNADTISSIISPTDIMSPEDMRVVNMVDSAGYASEGIGVDEIKNYVYNYKKDSSSKENQLRFGMVVNKLLLAYKNKANYLKSVVMESKPSLLSMYNVMMGIINQHIEADEKGWSLPAKLQKNAEWYKEKQKENIVKNGSVSTIEELQKGKNAVIGNCVVQVGGGQMNKTGSYDRYTAFSLHTDCEYFIMIWDTIGMMQVSTNNWNQNIQGKSIDLIDLVMKQIFEEKYKPLLDKPKYNISLLAIKKASEEKITKELEGDSVGFGMEQFTSLYGNTFHLSDNQKKWLEKCMEYRPSDFTPNPEDSDRKKEYKFKCAKFLNSFKIPLSEIILKTSGGHATICNLNGFGFLNEQQRINKAFKKGKNPFEKSTEQSSPEASKKVEPENPYESTSLKILKSIAKDVVNALNKSVVKESFDKLYDEATEDFKVGDEFYFKAPGYQVSNKNLRIIQTRKIEGHPTSYVLEDESGLFQPIMTKHRIIDFLNKGFMEKSFKEPEWDGNWDDENDEKTLKEMRSVQSLINELL